MVSSVLDDASHESPRFQFETFRKRLTTTKDRLAISAAGRRSGRGRHSISYENRRQGPGSFELDPVSKIQRTWWNAEERFSAAYRAIRNGQAAS